ncbi:spore coat protein [Virgibacillus salexigens]|uniref:spore coat protein n=1 Tax=Virgibacillus salexigens TaxID=61016 RepID=UPI003F68EB83
MNLRELLKFYPYSPLPGESSEYRIDDSFLAGDLLGLAKAAVRNYGVAITETATPTLRKVFKRQLNKTVSCHDVFSNTCIIMAFLTI